METPPACISSLATSIFYIHGLRGHDAMGPGLAEVIRSLPRYGVTVFMATTLTLPRQEILDALPTMADVLERPPMGPAASASISKALTCHPRAQAWRRLSGFRR